MITGTKKRRGYIRNISEMDSTELWGLDMGSLRGRVKKNDSIISCLWDWEESCTLGYNHMNSRSRSRIRRKGDHVTYPGIGAHGMILMRR